MGAGDRLALSVLAAILADSEGATALLAGTLTCAALAIVGGIIDVRACR
jgi:hypothetical protein